MELLAHLNETIEEHSIRSYKMSLELSALNGTDGNRKDLCSLASIFHDIGKCTPEFQYNLQNQGNNKQFYPHNLLSALYFYRYIHFDDSTKQREHDIIAHSILFHHPIENYEDLNLSSYCEEWGCEDITCIDNDTLLAMHTIADKLIDTYNSMCCEKNKIRRLDNGGFERKTIIDCFNNFMPFTVSSLVSPRNIDYIGISGNLKCADVLVSKQIEDISSYFNLSNGNSFTIDDFKCPEHFDKDLFNIQKDYVINIINDYNSGKHTFFEINEPVGFGKTVIYALASLMINKKVVIVSPTNDIAKNSYRSVVDFLKQFGLTDKVSCGLLITNQWHDFDENNKEFIKPSNFDECKNDIIITNIDNYMRPLFKSDEKKYMAFDLNYRTVIFDEYHNYCGKSALMNDFKTVCKSRKLFGNSLTILTSATREPNIIQSIGDSLITLPKTCYNCNKRHIEINKRKIDYTIDKENTLFIFNSISEAQTQAALFHAANPNAKYLIFHSEHTKKDRSDKERELISTHGKHSKDRSLCVFATNIATTGLDISFKKVVITQMPINEMYQSMGRCNRFNEYDCGEVIVDFSVTENKRSSECASIKNRYNLDLCDIEKRMFDKNFNNSVYDIASIDSIFGTITSNSYYLQEKAKYFKMLEKESGEMMGQLSFSYNKKYEVEEGVEYISRRVNLRTNKSKEGIENELFIWCEGMKPDEYVNKRFLKIGPQETGYMLDYLESHKTLIPKYFNEHEFKRKYNNFNKDLNKMVDITNELIDMAKCSKTPFIIRDYNYTHNTGVIKIKQK